MRSITLTAATGGRASLLLRERLALPGAPGRRLRRVRIFDLRPAPVQQGAPSRPSNGVRLGTIWMTGVVMNQSYRTIDNRWNTTGFSRSSSGT